MYNETQSTGKLLCLQCVSKPVCKAHLNQSFREFTISWMLLTNIVLMATVGTQLQARHVHTTFTATLQHVFLCRSVVKSNTHLAHAQNALPNLGREYSTVAKHWSKGFPYQTRRLLHSVMLKAEISNIWWMLTILVFHYHFLHWAPFMHLGRKEAYGYRASSWPAPQCKKEIV